MEKTDVFKNLTREATYAYNSFSITLVYQTYGAATMAWMLGSITRQEFDQLNELLVRESLNNGKWMNKAHEASHL